MGLMDGLKKVGDWVSPGKNIQRITGFVGNGLEDLSIKWAQTVNKIADSKFVPTPFKPLVKLGALPAAGLGFVGSTVATTGLLAGGIVQFVTNPNYTISTIMNGVKLGKAIKDDPGGTLKLMASAVVDGYKQNIKEGGVVYGVGRIGADIMFAVATGGAGQTAQAGLLAKTGEAANAIKLAAAGTRFEGMVASAEKVAVAVKSVDAGKIVGQGADKFRQTFRLSDNAAEMAASKNGLLNNIKGVRNPFRSTDVESVSAGIVQQMKSGAIKAGQEQEALNVAVRQFTKFDASAEDLASLATKLKSAAPELEQYVDDAIKLHPASVTRAAFVKNFDRLPEFTKSFSEIAKMKDPARIEAALKTFSSDLKKALPRDIDGVGLNGIRNELIKAATTSTASADDLARLGQLADQGLVAYNGRIGGMASAYAQGVNRRLTKAEDFVTDVFGKRPADSLYPGKRVIAMVGGTAAHNAQRSGTSVEAIALRAEMASKGVRRGPDGVPYIKQSNGQGGFVNVPLTAGDLADYATNKGITPEDIKNAWQIDDKAFEAIKNGATPPTMVPTPDDLLAQGYSPAQVEQMLAQGQAAQGAQTVAQGQVAADPTMVPGGVETGATDESLERLASLPSTMTRPQEVDPILDAIENDSTNQQAGGFRLYN